MNRPEMLQRLDADEEIWDIAIIGGGATGLSCAHDAALRGYRTVLIEQHDFAKGTSSRSTKLIHGGVRYLAQGNVSLVKEALHERDPPFQKRRGLGETVSRSSSRLPLLGARLLRRRPLDV